MIDRRAEIQNWRQIERKRQTDRQTNRERKTRHRGRNLLSYFSY